MRERNPIIEEIISALLAFDQRKKTSDGSSHGEGFMAKGNKKRGRNKFWSESSRNNS